MPPQVINLEDSPDRSSFSDDEVELRGYATSDADEDDDEAPAIITIADDGDDDDNGDSSPEISSDDDVPGEISLERLSIQEGLSVAPGDTVELEDTTEKKTLMQSGDFFRIEGIVENLQSRSITLKGYRLRRCKTLSPQFDRKLNELFMVVYAKASDPRPHMIQGIEDINVDQVLKKRECILTHQPYRAFSFREYPPRIPTDIVEDKQLVKEFMFHSSRLFCRWVNILVLDDNGKAYSGEVRLLYRHESDPLPSVTPSSGPSAGPVKQNNKEDDDCVIIKVRGTSSETAHHRSNSVKIVDNPSHRLPRRPKRYSFADCFCGAGGTSQGAVQADLTVNWGADFDRTCMETYQANFPGAMSLYMDVHDIPALVEGDKEYRVDILHLSCPCCYWSPAHTRDGPNDQENLEALYTVGPCVKAIKPRVVSLEQTPGLLTLRKHRLYWRLLINQLITEDYNVRYTIQDLAWFGLPQRRRRLIIVAAKLGTPIPPFPPPTHGLRRSGLKPFTSIFDALQPLNSLTLNDLSHDNYHQIHSMERLNKPATNPKLTQVNTLTTHGLGSGNYHYSGRRRYSPRELSLFQGFQVGFKFRGRDTQVVKMIGNAYPPIMSSAVLLMVAQTLEAFDHGFINNDENIVDLYDTFLAKGIELPEKPNRPATVSLFENRPSEKKFLYLDKLVPTIKSKRKHKLWGRTMPLEPAPEPQNNRKRRASAGFGLFDGKYRSSSSPKKPKTRESSEVIDLVGSDEEDTDFKNYRSSNLDGCPGSEDYPIELDSE